MDGFILSQHKSKIAGHLNYGGGWLIFGIEDDGSHAEPHPGNVNSYRQDIMK